MKYTLHYFSPKGGLPIHKTTVDDVRCHLSDFVAKVRGLRDAGGQGALPGIDDVHDGPILVANHAGLMRLIPAKEASDATP